MKPFYHSKTWWTNVMLLLIAILSLPQLGGVIPESWLPYIGMIAAVANVILRFITSEPVGFK